MHFKGKKAPISNEKQFQKHSKEKILAQAGVNQNEFNEHSKNIGKKNVTFKESDVVVAAADKEDISKHESDELLHKDVIEEVSNDEPSHHEELEHVQEKEENNPTSTAHSRVSVIPPQEPDPSKKS